MARKLQLLLMIFCLGIFVFPKQNVVMQLSQSSCCKTEKTDISDSKKSNSCDHHSKQEKECKDNCTTCKVCASCYAFSVIPTELKPEVFKISQSKHQLFSYKNQILLARSFNIWQPPKIA